MYITIFFSGAAVLIIEIAGTRVLSPFYGSTIFVWSSLIITTLGFLALGYFFGGVVADKYPEGKWFYSIIFAGGAAALLLLKFNQPILIYSDRFGLKTGPLAAAIMLFALPLCIFSMASPFAIRLQSKAVEKAGHVSGRIFAISTAGSLLGAVLAGFYLIPNFLLKDIFSVTAIVIMLIAFIGLIIEKAPQNIIIPTVIILTIILALSFREYKTQEDVITMIHQEPSFYADLQVGEARGNRMLFMDGNLQTGVLKEKNLGPILIQYNKPSAKYIIEIQRLSEDWATNSDVLLLGLGGGSLDNALHDDFAVDAVEIDPKIAKLAKEYFYHTSDENNELFIEDARSFLRKTDKKYDYIIIDLSLGNTLPFHFYTKESVELIRDHLKNNGAVVMNLSMRYSENNAALTSILRTFDEVFPEIIVTIPEEEEHLVNMLVHTSKNPNYNPGLNGDYHEVELNFSDGVVLTDQKNPLEVYLVQSLEEFLKEQKRIFGLEPLFSI